jgi:ribosomal protein S4E
VNGKVEPVKKHHGRKEVMGVSDNKPKPFKTIKMYVIAVLNKAKPETENTRCLNLVVVRHVTVQMTELLL